MTAEMKNITKTVIADLSIDGQIISSGKIVCKGCYLFPININSHHYVLQNKRTK